MKSIKKSQAGFTVIELMVAILLVSVVSVLALNSIRTMRAEHRDDTKKSDINAIYFQLESFYEKTNYYPEKIDSKTLSGIDPESLKDEHGTNIGSDSAKYKYKPRDCAENKCKSYTLETDLDREDMYKKQSLHQ